MAAEVDWVVYLTLVIGEQIDVCLRARLEAAASSRSYVRVTDTQSQRSTETSLIQRLFLERPTHVSPGRFRLGSRHALAL